MDSNNQPNTILNNEIQNLKYLLMADGLAAHINETIEILNKIIQLNNLDIYSNKTVQLFILTLEKILETQDISNIFIKICVSYIKTGYIIKNLLEENKILDDKDIVCDNPTTNITKNLIIKNAPENYEYLITEIPECAEPGYYFKTNHVEKDTEIQDTYYMNNNGEIIFINSVQIKPPVLSNMFANLLGNEIIEENDL